MTAYIGYDNAFEQDGVTVSTVWTPPAGFELANAYDYKTHTAVKYINTSTNYINLDAGSGETISANYFAYIANTWEDVFSLTLQYSDDDITYTTHINVGWVAGLNQNDNVKFGYDSTTETHRYWRIRLFSPTSNSMIYHMAFGVALECQPIGTGFKPPIYEHYDSINAQGNAANYLGRSIKRQPMDLRIKQQGIDPAALRTDWVPFLEHAARKPFFFSWDYENYPHEPVYCWTEKPQQPTYTSLCHASIDLAVKAIKA